MGDVCGQISNEDGAAVALTGGQEGLVSIVAGSSTVLLQVEGTDGVDSVVAKGLYKVSGRTNGGSFERLGGKKQNETLKQSSTKKVKGKKIRQEMSAVDRGQDSPGADRELHQTWRTRPERWAADAGARAAGDA